MRRICSDDRSRLRTLALTVGLAFGCGLLEAQNLELEGDFNSASATASWTVEVGQSSWAEFNDADGCPGSGSLAAICSSPVTLPDRVRLIGPCHPWPGGTEARVSARIFVIGDEFGVPFGTLDTVAFSSDDCAPASEVLRDTFQTFGASPDWIDIERQITLPSGVQSVRFVVKGQDISANLCEVLVDRLYVGVLEPVFRDDFEAGSTCRWTGAGGRPPS